MTSDVDSLQELVQTGLLTLIGNGFLLLLSLLVPASVTVLPELVVIAVPATWLSVYAEHRLASISEDGLLPPAAALGFTFAVATSLSFWLS